jgi:hypothetical protein
MSSPLVSSTTSPTFLVFLKGNPDCFLAALILFKFINSVLKTPISIVLGTENNAPEEVEKAHSRFLEFQKIIAENYGIKTELIMYDYFETVGLSESESARLNKALNDSTHIFCTVITRSLFDSAIKRLTMKHELYTYGSTNLKPLDKWYKAHTDIGQGSVEFFNFFTKSVICESALATGDDNSLKPETNPDIYDVLSGKHSIFNSFLLKVVEQDRIPRYNKACSKVAELETKQKEHDLTDKEKIELEQKKKMVLNMSTPFQMLLACATLSVMVASENISNLMTSGFLMRNSRGYTCIVGEENPGITTSKEVRSLIGSYRNVVLKEIFGILESM